MLDNYSPDVIDLESPVPHIPESIKTPEKIVPCDIDFFLKAKILFIKNKISCRLKALKEENNQEPI